MEQRAQTSRRMAKETRDYHGCDPYLFIVGCARSGTTLMRRIVDAHPEIAITTEMHWISHYFDYFKSRNSLVTPELVSELTGHKRFAQFEIPRQQFEGLLGSGEAVPYPTFLRRVFGLYGKINRWWATRPPATCAASLHSTPSGPRRSSSTSSATAGTSACPF
jgi:hypothetical protein